MSQRDRQTVTVIYVVDADTAIAHNQDPDDALTTHNRACNIGNRVYQASIKSSRFPLAHSSQ
jgi:hypothetical protein